MELGLKLPQRAYELLNLRKGEEGTVALMLAFSFFQYFSLALLFITASAIFLTDHSISELPMVYIATAVSLLALTLIFNQFEKKFSARQIILAEVLLVLLLLLLFRFGFSFDIVWMGYALMVGHRVISDYVGDGYHRLALLLFDVRQSKRLYGLITSSEIPANLLGYLAATSLIPFMGTADLLWVSALGILISLLFLFIIVYRGNNKTALNEETESETPGQVQKEETDVIKKFFKTRLIFFLCVTMVFSVFSFMFIEFAFLNKVAAETQNQKEVVFFMAVIFGAGQFLAFFIKTFLYGFIQRRFGTKITLFVLPFALAIICVASLLEGYFSNSTFLLVYTWIAIMLISDTLNSSLYNTTFLTLLQPLGKKLKMEGYTIINNVEIFAIGAGGLILLAANAGSNDDFTRYSILLLAGTFGWIISIPILSKSYLNTLEDVLKKRTAESSAIEIDTPQTLQIIHEKLKSPHPGEVLFALDFLCKGRNERQDELLAELLVHPIPEVRKEVFRRIETMKVHTLVNEVRKRIHEEPVPALRKTALHTYCSLGEASVVDEVSPMLESEDPDIQTGALVGLISYGGINGIIIAGQRLMEYVNSPNASLRAFGAHVIGEVGIHNFYHPLLSLLRDDALPVQREALKAAGKIRHPRLYDAMIKAVSVQTLFENAMNNLIRCGEGVVETIEPELTKQAGNPVYLRRLIYICGRVGGPRSLNLLKDKLYYPNIEVREQILHSCFLSDFKPDAQEKGIILKTIHSELADAAWWLNCIEVVGYTQRWMEKADISMMLRALTIELNHLKKRLLYLLSFLYHSREILMIWESLQLKNRIKIANALEILDVVGSKELTAVIMPILEDFPINQQLKILNARYTVQRLSLDEYLRKLIEGRECPGINRWTQIVSITMVNKVRVSSLIHQLVALRENEVELLAQTAQSTLYSILADAEEDFREEPALSSVLAQKELLKPMETKLLAIEKVMALKTTGIFRESPEDLLLEISSILKEMFYQRGDVIVRKGEIGTCMYIIYSGSVKVHDADFTLATLKNGDFFGELSLLDTEPRSASVTAVDDSLLLRIDQQAFYEIMADRMEVIREIMKILCQRLRNQNLEVARLSEKLQTQVN